MTVVAFVIPAQAAPQGSKDLVPRTIRGRTRLVPVEASGRTAPYRAEAFAAARRARERAGLAGALSGPVDVELLFVLPRPASHYRTGRYADQLKPDAPREPTSHQLGDLDKLARATLDGIAPKSGLGVIADDSLVVRLTCHERWAERLPVRERPHVHVRITHAGLRPPPPAACEVCRLPHYGFTTCP